MRLPSRRLQIEARAFLVCVDTLSSGHDAQEIRHGRNVNRGQYHFVRFESACEGFWAFVLARSEGRQRDQSLDHPAQWGCPGRAVGATTKSVVCEGFTRCCVLWCISYKRRQMIEFGLQG